MNRFTAEAAESAAAAQAFQGSTNPERHRLLVEAVGFATVGNAIDAAELLAITRATSLDQAAEVFGLVKAEEALDLAGIDDDGHALLAKIRDGLLDPESTLQLAVYDATSYDADLITLAAAMLKVDEERLAAFVGGEREYVITDAEGFDPFAEARAAEAEKAARKAAKKAAKEAGDA